PPPGGRLAPGRAPDRLARDRVRDGLLEAGQVERDRDLKNSRATLDPALGLAVLADGRVEVARHLERGGAVRALDLDRLRHRVDDTLTGARLTERTGNIPA